MNANISLEQDPSRSLVLGLYRFKSQHIAELFPFLKDCLRDRVATHPAACSTVSCRVITIFGPEGCGLFETSQPCQKSVGSIEMGECFRLSTSEPLKPRFDQPVNMAACLVKSTRSWCIFHSACARVSPTGRVFALTSSNPRFCDNGRRWFVRWLHGTRYSER